ncbi:MAG TPA: hypothetical protein VL403_16230, partial [Candidatus Kryptonia bacterium]|nr:hypothetical protein [Candidatus Kryptonia bacterium]
MPLWPGVAVAVLAGAVYLAVASRGTFHFRPSLFPYHVWVADAWLHGQLHIRDEVIAARSEPFYAQYRTTLEQRLSAEGRRLSESDWLALRGRLKTPAMHDLAFVDGKFYGVWGPAVPALLLPYVAWRGLAASDMLVSCLVAIGTVWLTYLMLRQAQQIGVVPLDTAACTALTLLLGLGTIHFYMCVLGQVWYLSQIVAEFFVTLAVWCLLHAGRGLAWLVAAGAGFGAALLSRGSILTLAPFFCVGIFALWLRFDGTRLRGVAWAAAFALPLLLAGVIAMSFNYARFGSVLDSGNNIMTGGDPMFQSDYFRYGIFNLHYLPRNLYYYFLNPTLLRDQRTGALTFDPWGNSMFLVTPALLYVFRAGGRDWFTLGLWLGAGSCMTMLLLFQFSGWFNFGTRYLLDLMPLAILLIAIGMRGRLTRASIALIAL